MPNNYNMAVTLATDQITEKAYYEYYDNVVYQYTNLIECISAVTTSESISDIFADHTDALTKFSLNTQLTIDGKHTISVQNLMSSFQDALITAEDRIDHDQSTDADVVLHLQYSDGSEEDINSSVVFSALNSQLHAAVVEQAVAEAYMAGESIAERVQLLRDSISSRFVSGYTDVSNCLTYAANKIKYGANFRSYINDKLQSSGIADGIDSGDISNSEDIQYTGTSSGFAALFYAGRNIIETGANFIKAACEFNFKFMFRATAGIGKLLVKGFRFIHEHLIDPNEIASTDDPKGNFTFEGLYYDGEENINHDDPLVSRLELTPIQLDFPTCEVIVQKDPDSIPYHNPISTIEGGLDLMHDMIYDQTGSDDCPAYAFEPYLEYLNSVIDVTDPTLEQDNIQDALSIIWTMVFGLPPAQDYPILTFLQNMYDKIYQAHFAYKVHVMIKFKPINPDFVSLTGTLDDDYYYYNATDVYNALEQIAYDPTAYVFNDPLDNSSAKALIKETYMYKGLYLAKALTTMTLQILYRESTGQSIEGWSCRLKRDINADMNNISSTLLSPITNLDWFNSLTSNIEKIGGSEIDVQFGYTGVLGILNNVFAYQDAHPSDYPFFPYATRDVKWSPASYTVLNDAQVQQAMNTFVTKAIIIIAVIFLGIKAFKGIKNLASRTMLNEQGALWKATEAASQGTLTQDLINAYRKAHLKNSVLSFLTGNLLSATTMNTSKLTDLNRNYNEVTTDLSPVIRLIRGF